MFNNGTLLDDILKDLQLIIIEYIRTYPLFIIGKYNITYDGYRLVDKSDMDNPDFVKLLVDSYWVNGGIYSIDDSSGYVLCIKGYILCVGEVFYENFLRTRVVHNNHRWVYDGIKKGDIIPFYTYRDGDMVSGIDNVKYFFREYYVEKIELFVKNDFIISERTNWIRLLMI